MLKNLSCESPFIIKYILENKIKAKNIANTCAIRYGFIDKKFEKTVCQVLEIKPQCLIKPKQIQKFNGKATKPIIHTIYSILTISTHTKSFILLLIMKLENHPIIFGQPWMKKYGTIIDIINNFLAFWLDYCIYIGVISPTILNLPSLPIKTTAVRTKEAITSQKIIKKSSIKDMTNFLQMSNKLLSKKRRQNNKSKQKTSMRETSSKSYY